jgi:hypothetical protein
MPASQAPPKQEKAQRVQRTGKERVMNWLKAYSIAFLAIIFLSFSMSYSYSQNIDPLPDSLISIPETLPNIDKGDVDIDPFIPIDPCLNADLVVSIDLADGSDTSVRSDSNYYMQTIAYPFSISGNQAGFIKMEYNRVDVNNVNGTEGIQYVTCKDTFYFTDAKITAFGERRNTTFGKYKGSGFITKIINNETNQITDVNISYNFNFVNRQTREICFYIQ